METYSIDEINGMLPAEFVELFGGVYASSWWVAEAAASRRPFCDFEDLRKVMAEVVESADEDRKMVILAGAPSLKPAHGEAARLLREIVGSDYEVRLRLPGWVDDEVSLHPANFRSDESRMEFVIGLSRRNVEQGTGGPFGAAVFECGSGRLVAPGINMVVAGHSSVAHAEALAFMLAQQDLETFDLGADGLPAMELVASSQPCIQCYGMTWWSGVRRLVIGARARDVERITGFAEGPLPEDWVGCLENRPPPLRPIEVRRDVMAREACRILEAYRDSGGFIYNPGSDQD